MARNKTAAHAAKNALVGLVVAALLLTSGCVKVNNPPITVVVPEPTSTTATQVQQTQSAVVPASTTETVPPLPVGTLDVRSWKGAIRALNSPENSDILKRMYQLKGKNFVKKELARLEYDYDHGIFHTWKAPRAGMTFIDTDLGSNREDGRWKPFHNTTTKGQKFLTWTDGTPALRIGCLNPVSFYAGKTPRKSVHVAPTRITRRVIIKKVVIKKVVKKHKKVVKGCGNKKSSGSTADTVQKTIGTSGGAGQE